MSRGETLYLIPTRQRVSSYSRTGAILGAFFVLCAWLTHSLTAHAATQFVQVSPDGLEYQVHVAAHSGEASPIVAYFLSPGRSSVAIEVGIEGPTGLRGVAFGAQVDAERIDETLPIVPWQPQSWMKIRDEVSVKAKEYDGFAIASKDHNGTSRFLYHGHKDACASERKASYLTGLLLDISGVPPESRAVGFTIRLAMREHQFQGAQVASIKPSSDGQYRGEPILLMGAVQYGDEYVNIVRRSRGGVRSKRRIPVVKYVSYKGHTLSLARLRGVLRGGRATFELTNGGLIYGVCFELQRRRQVVNGYPLSR